jgi:beta-lactam-binding protein with PASTA domain
MTADHAVTAGFARKGRCKVPNVVGLRLVRVKTRLTRAQCALGKITKKFSSPRKKGRVLAQRPKSGKTLPAGAKITLKTGKGPRKK